MAKPFETKLTSSEAAEIFIAMCEVASRMDRNIADLRSARLPETELSHCDDIEDINTWTARRDAARSAALKAVALSETPHVTNASKRREDAAKASIEDAKAEGPTKPYPGAKPLTAADRDRFFNVVDEPE